MILMSVQKLVPTLGIMSFSLYKKVILKISFDNNYYLSELPLSYPYLMTFFSELHVTYIFTWNVLFYNEFWEYKQLNMFYSLQID